MNDNEDSLDYFIAYTPAVMTYLKYFYGGRSLQSKSFRSSQKS